MQQIWTLRIVPVRRKFLVQAGAASADAPCQRLSGAGKRACLTQHPCAWPRRDRAVLHKYRFSTARLVDLHNLWTVSAWASSVAVAFATGIATVIVVGLQPFVIGVITPSSPAPPQHAVVSQR